MRVHSMRSQSGMVLLVAIVLLLLAGVLTLFALKVGVFEQRSTGNDMRSKVVADVAEAGLADVDDVVRERGGICYGMRRERHPHHESHHPPRHPHARCVEQGMCPVAWAARSMAVKATYVRTATLRRHPRDGASAWEPPTVVRECTRWWRDGSPGRLSWHGSRAFRSLRWRALRSSRGAFARANCSTRSACWATEKICAPLVCPFQRATLARPWAMSSISTSSGEGSSRSRRRPDSMRCQARGLFDRPRAFFISSCARAWRRPRGDDRSPDGH